MTLQEKPPLDELYHYGIKRRSGRYPWGSGEEPYQHSGDFLSRIDELKKSGLSDSEIAKHFNLTTENYRMEKRLANHERQMEKYKRIKSLSDDGLNPYEIGRQMGINESSVREYLNPNKAAKLVQVQNTADYLKKQIEEKEIIDIGKGVEKELGISRGQLDESIYLLKMEGYETHKRYIGQVTNKGKNTTYEVLCKPGTKYEEVRDMVGEIQSITDYKSQDGGKTFQPKFVYPKSLDSKRLQICYDEDGGSQKDGIIELRRGVDDISLGNDHYAQVRILVDGDRYLKGVAVYADDLPDGVDVRFNTNKKRDVPMRDVLKKIKENSDNPFGTNIKPMEEGGQRYYIDKDGKQQLSLINKKSSEGDWSEWSNSLPSQFLSKQPLDLAKRQLNAAAKSHQDEFDEIKSLTNPTVKKKLLEEFASECDSAAVHLKAASLPHQQHHLIVPINTLKDNEIYAPNYENGTVVALVRYPHGGTFEIPKLVVNNKNAMGKKLLGGDVPDAVGINHKVAERLSGADFDGDTVMVIPNANYHKIKNRDQLRDLVGFDPKLKYGTIEKDGKYYNQDGLEVKVMSENYKQKQMGIVTNLIADMTIAGASDQELAKAVKHSMVVIDAAKHKLDYKQSEVDNDIKRLKLEWQGIYNEETNRTNTPAATLLTRAKSDQPVIKRQGTPKINVKGKSYYDPTKPEGALLYKESKKAYYPEYERDKNNPDLRGFRLANGKKVFYDPSDPKQLEYYRPVQVKDKKTGEVYFTNSTGELKYRTSTRMQKSTKMAETDDARTLISKHNTQMEQLYADYANKMKAMANEARKEYATTKGVMYSSSAKEIYKNEANSLQSKLNEALKNAPRERKAQLIAKVDVEAAKQSNPDMTKDEIKKVEQRYLERARETVGAKRSKIVITDREWEAIQAGAITKTTLENILKFTDMDVVRDKAMPRNVKSLNDAQVNSLMAKYKTGRYTRQELATAFNVSVGTIARILDGKE